MAPRPAPARGLTRGWRGGRLRVPKRLWEAGPLGCCGLTEYGRREIAAITCVFVLVCAAVLAAALWVSWWFGTAAAAALAAYACALAFFRDPRRVPPPGEGLLVSPADGRVSDITRVGADSPLGCDGVKVGVFMNIFNVHVNRVPAGGRVESIERRGGAFLDARDPLAGERNEATTVTIAHTRGGREHPIVVRQVAGLIARRIVTDLAEGQQVLRGQRMGMIKFGSRLELLVPDSLSGEVRVQVGQTVRAGLSVLVAAGGKGRDASRTDG